MTAQPSPDLPDSLRRDRKPATAAGEDLHLAAAYAYVGLGDPDGFVDDVIWGDIQRPDDFRAAVDRVAELVRAECPGCGCDGDPIECGHEAALGAAEEQIRQITAERNTAAHFNEHCQTVADRWAAAARQLTADLAAMTARAESAEAMYDRARPVVAAAEAWLDAPMEPAYVMEYALERAINEYRVALIRAHDETGPLSGPSATESAREASSVDAAGSQGQRGSEGVSGGAA